LLRVGTGAILLLGYRESGSCFDSAAESTFSARRFFAAVTANLSFSALKPSAGSVHTEKTAFGFGSVGPNSWAQAAHRSAASLALANSLRPGFHGCRLKFLADFPNSEFVLKLSILCHSDP